MDERHLRAFVEVADKLSFRRAAESLHMSTSPLSREVRELEAELGATLFERDTRHVRLTAAGHEALPTAISILANMNDMRRGVGRMTQGARTIRVGLRAAPEDFRPAIHTILSPTGEPAIHLEPLESAVQVRQLLTGALDLALTLQDAGDRRFGSWPLFTEPYAIALPDRPEFAELDVVFPEHLAELRIVSLTPAADVERFAVNPAIAPYIRAATGIVPGADLIPGGIHMLIASGTHCSFVMGDPGSPWHKSIAGDGVIFRPLPESIPPIVTRAVWLASRAGDDDLGPIIQRIVEAFPEPWSYGGAATDRPTLADALPVG